MGQTGRTISLPEYTTQKNHLLHSSVVDGLAFSWANVLYDYAALDTILLVENTSTTHNLVIDQIWCHSDTTTTVIVHATNEAALTHAGTSVTGVNLNRSSSNVAAATATADETNNVQGNTLWSGSIAADSATPVLVNAGVVLDFDDIIAVDFTDVGTQAAVTIIGHYERA
jgi:hypothetical protein